MDYFRPGLRELTRKIHRQLSRRRAAARRSDLEKAETELGLLGWQQADFDADTQRQVTEIQDVEREQGRVANRAAELGQEIQRREEEHNNARRAYEESRRPLDAERRKLREPYEALERQLAEKRGSSPDFQSRIPELDRELREVTRLYSELLTRQPQTPQIRQELQRLRERTVAIPNEKAEVRMLHLRIATETRELEETLAREAEVIVAVEARIRNLEEKWTQREAVFAQELDELKREKTKVEQQSDVLEGAKANPYQRVGQVLADNNIAPINQPQALEKVKRLRFAVGEMTQVILESEAQSAREDVAVVRRSYLVWAVMAFVLLLVVISLLAP